MTFLPIFCSDPHWRQLVLFHEYFGGDTATGLGASYQTGWTALIARLLEDIVRKVQRRLLVKNKT
ncbi:hypothetical protein NIES2101_12525 [Calothrix sp. HK-06]|nr:hypothetical protein NIES2101_12525 [Calothrix sp. HK-06]